MIYKAIRKELKCFSDSRNNYLGAIFVLAVDFSRLIGIANYIPGATAVYISARFSPSSIAKNTKRDLKRYLTQLTIRRLESKKNLGIMQSPIIFVFEFINEYRMEI